MDEPCDVNECKKYPDARCENEYCVVCRARYYVDNKEVDCESELSTWKPDNDYDTVRRINN